LIPRDYITEWRANAPWVQDFQVEQDLVICRALIAIFTHPLLAKALAFRGGTALYKLHFKPAARYSEDIDLVQINAEPAGPLMGALREVLDPWLGEPRSKQSEARVTFVYRFASEDAPPVPLRLKVEINSREHLSVYGRTQVPFSVSSRWFAGAADIGTYALDELLATKLRALYQRKKSRDLFDLAVALEQGNADPARIVSAFSRYMEHGGHRVSRAEFERTMEAKLRDRAFHADIGPMLMRGYHWDIAGPAALIGSHLIERLPGEPWQGDGNSKKPGRR
jgi:predicted nucleotidyltransferase component of viral defense system